MVRNILCALALAGAASPLAASPLNVRVVDASGRPVRDAVVTLYPAGSARPPRPGGRDPVALAELLRDLRVRFAARDEPEYV